MAPVARRGFDSYTVHMWHIKRTRYIVGPYAWEWQCASTAYGLIWGHAWTKRQAERRLLRAEYELYGF